MEALQTIKKIYDGAYRITGGTLTEALKQTEKIKECTKLVFEGSQFSNKALDLIKTFPNIKYLTIKGATQITDSALSDFLANAKLFQFGLKNCHFSAEALKDLSAMGWRDSLHDLTLQGLKLNDVEFADLAGRLANLGTLKLADLKGLTNQGLTHLDKCKNVSWLKLGNVPINDQGMDAISSLKLRGLSMKKLKGISDEAFASACKKLTRVSTFKLKNVPIGGQGIGQLSGLTYLTIRGSNINLPSVWNCPKLQDILLRGEKISNLEFLNQIKTLEELDFKGLTFSAKQLQTLSSLQTLEFLTLNKCHFKPDSSLFTKAFPSLEGVEFDNCPDVTAEFAKKIANARPKLEVGFAVGKCWQAWNLEDY